MTRVRLLLVVAALLGLFGMHGLAAHGAQGGAAAMPEMSQTASAMHAFPSPGAVVEAAPWGHGSMGGGDMALCVGVVALGLLLLALRRSVLDARPLLAARSSTSSVPPARARAPDPPDPIRLCVQRC